MPSYCFDKPVHHGTRMLGITDADWKDWIVLAMFLGSGISVIFMSSPRFLGPYVDDSVRYFLCVAPIVSIILFRQWKWLFVRSNRTILFIVSVLLLTGLANTIFSDNVSQCGKAMFRFVVTGLVPLVTCLVIFRHSNLVKHFDVFTAVSLGLVVLIETIAYIQRGIGDWVHIGVLARNPIPTGTLAILLCSGPIWLAESRNRWQAATGYSLLASAAGLILLTRRKGAFLSACLMWGLHSIKKRNKLILRAVPILLILFAAVTLHELDWSRIMDPEVPRNRSHLDRIEFYSFAYHVFNKHPFLGIGLRPYTHHHYLADYSRVNEGLKHFDEVVENIQTFDNMYVTLIVETGSLFAGMYFILTGFIFVNFYRCYRAFPEMNRQRIYRVLPLVGFAFHSLTYDSLMFEPVNWLFHSHVGILAASTFSSHQSASEQFSGAGE